MHSVDLKLDGHAPCKLVCLGRPALDADQHIEHQRGPIAVLSTFDIRHPYAQVVHGSIRVGEQKQVHALQPGILFAQHIPASAVRLPVVFLQVRADPDIGTPGFTGLEIGQGLLQHARNVRAGSTGGGAGQIEQGLR